MQQLKEMVNHLEQKVLHIEKQNEEVLMMLKSIRECQKRDAIGSTSQLKTLHTRLATEDYMY